MGDDTLPGGTHLARVAGSCSVCERRPSPPQPWAGITKPELLAQHVHAKSPQSCLTLCNPRACSPPGSSVLGILQARILEWVAMPSSRGSSRPRDGTPSLTSPTLAGGFFTASATWAGPGLILPPLLATPFQSRLTSPATKLVTEGKNDDFLGRRGFMPGPQAQSLSSWCPPLVVFIRFLAGCWLLRWLLSSGRHGMVGIWAGGGRGAHSEDSRTRGTRGERCLYIASLDTHHASPWCTITAKPVKQLQINREKAKCLIALVRLPGREGSHTARRLLPLLLA